MAALLSQYGKTMFFVFVHQFILRLPLLYNKYPRIVVD